MMKEPLDNRVEASVSATFKNKHRSVKIGVSTREKGVSVAPYHSFNMGFHVGDQYESVLKNREILANDLAFPLDQWVFGEQIHATHIERVTLKEAGRGVKALDTVIPGADGLYTTDSDLMLAALYADCVPLFFFASDLSAIGVAHAGWRGTVGEIGGKMVTTWHEQLGIEPNKISVIIGPSIGSCCYEVDDRLADEVHRISGIDHSGLVVPSKPGHYQLDLQSTNRRILEKFGVHPSNIHMTQYCTGCRTDLFYSHRQEKGQTGRMVGYIGIEIE